MQLPKIEFSMEVASGGHRSDAMALGWFQADRDDSEKGKPKSRASLLYLGKLSKDVEALSERLKKSGHFAGKKNEVSSLRFFEHAGFPNTLLLGLGSRPKWDREVARQAGAALYLAQKRERYSRITVQFDSVFSKSKNKETPFFVQAFCEGYLLAGYEYRDLKRKDPELFAPASMEFSGAKDKELVAAVEKATSVARAVNFARSLGDRPGNVLTPREFSRLIQSMTKERGLRCSILGRAEMEKEGMGLLLGVAKGSAEEPQLIVIEHRGGKKGEKPIALVGKGITFDSGGISLKPAARMEDMKYDMMGAAAVAGIMHAVGDLKPSVNIVAFIAAAENMPGGRAQKPGDVARSMSGKTVEIINTDAEGRLVLADALEYAQTRFDPQVIIDFATLTGAVVDALGTVTSGIMGNDQALLRRMKESAVATSERVWELPLYEEYEEDLRSNVADIKNSGIREAGSSKGGTFLKFFIDAKYPWVHCDIAGSAYHRKDVNYHPTKFGSGVMVRLVTHLLENWETLPRKS